jgi:UDP-N-acetylglucosamine 2-epimerase (non-hydrolysing)
MKVALIYGTRPEAIKLAPVIPALRQAGSVVTVINTGQHDSLMPQIMALFSVSIDYDLHLVRPQQTLGNLLGRMVQTLTPLLARLRPTVVMVQGDTMTALAGALAGFYLGLPVAHVEAGLRTYQPASPFPEEANRRLIGTIASWNFAPSERAVNNLIAEHVPGQIFLTGNPIVEAVRTIAKQTSVPQGKTGPRVIVTIHRRENFPHLKEIFKALARIAEHGVEVLFPVHANPVVAKAARDWLARTPVQLIAPLDYLPWVGLLKTADLIVTDSGGLQEEAPILGIPLLVVRQKTERPEVIDGGYGYLVGVQEDVIVHMTLSALSGKASFRQGSPYGDGTASWQIARVLTGVVPDAAPDVARVVGGE